MILKVTERCNSNCAYCDVVSNWSRAEDMPLDILEIVFRRTNEFLENRPEEHVTIIWHGGEPLLVGPHFYRAALEFQRKHCQNTRGRIKHSIQTNMTLFSENYAEVFRDLGIDQVGTSYDPEPHVRGPGPTHDSGLYNRMFMQGDALAEQHGYKSGIIYVVTKKSLENPLKVFYYLTNLKLGGSFAMNPVLLYDNRRDDLAITPEDYVTFLGTIFPLWWKYQNRYPDVDPFRSITQIIKDRELVLGCAESGACSYQHVNVDPYGETSQCGRSSDWGLLSYGNVREQSLAVVFSNSQRDDLKRRNEVLRQGGCRDCRFWTICHGGCPLDSYPKHADFLHISEWGCARKNFIEQYFEPITGLKFKPHE
jgi:uncharacterized protein